MFNPSPQDVRRFFCDTYRKWKGALPLTPLETIVADWVAQHPEYHNALSDVEAALAADYSLERGQGNPFLHLSMHLSISEQVGIDQPRGIKQAYELLRAKIGTHEAQHEMMDCLGETIYNSQRSGKPLDEAIYIEAVRKKALG